MVYDQITFFIIFVFRFLLRYIWGKKQIGKTWKTNGTTWKNQQNKSDSMEPWFESKTIIESLYSEACQAHVREIRRPVGVCERFSNRSFRVQVFASISVHFASCRIRGAAPLLSPQKRPGRGCPRRPGHSSGARIRCLKIEKCPKK